METTVQDRRARATIYSRVGVKTFTRQRDAKQERDRVNRLRGWVAVYKSRGRGWHEVELSVLIYRDNGEAVYRP